MDFTELCIEKNVSIRDAMKQLDKTATKILFIVEDGKLLAALTDGDIRRYLLAGGKMDGTADEAGNHNPKIAHSREQAYEMLAHNDYLAVPIVSADDTVVDICFKIKKDGNFHPNLNIPVVIMAGGKGTRLDPYTRVLPKPLIPVGDLPIIEHIMQQFEQYGCNDFHVIVNYKKQLIKAYFNESERRYKATWYDEDQPLGTGGGLYLLKSKINDTFFLTNCDVLLQSDYNSMLQFHRENGNYITMVCAYKNLTIPYGVIEMSRNGSIGAMKEKPEMSFLTNTGMYIVEPKVLDDIQDNVAVGFPDVVELQCQKGRKVAVYPVSENEWLDMGQMTELESMRKKLYGE